MVYIRGNEAVYIRSLAYDAPSPLPLPPPLPSAPPPPSPLFPLPPQQTKVSLNLVSWALFFALPRMFYILRNVLKPERRHFLISVLIILQLPIKNVCKHLLTWKLLPLILMVCSSSWLWTPRLERTVSANWVAQKNIKVYIGLLTRKIFRTYGVSSFVSIAS